MDVNKQLLEKYHTGLCTAQEKQLVKDWLNAETLEIAPALSESQKVTARQLIWDGLSSSINSQTTTKRSRPTRSHVKRLAAGIAASVALLWSIWTMVAPSRIAVYDNSSSIAPLWFKQKSYDVLMGEASRATIDIHAGKLMVEGKLLFKPKRDIQIWNDKKNMLLKQGETYIILEGNDIESQFIFSKNEVTFLPPSMQRKLKQQFNIT